MVPSRIADRWIVAALAGLCAASAAAWLARVGWPFELFSHFRLQLAAAAALLAPALWWLQRRRAAALAAGLAIVHFALAAPDLWFPAPAPSCGGTPLVVVTANVEYTNHDRRRFLRWLAAHPADVVALQEVTSAWATDLNALPGYPHRRILAREDAYGIAVLSRWPFEVVEPVDAAGDAAPSVEGIVRVGGQSISLLAMHTRWPITPRLWRSRDRSLLRAAAHARERALPTILAGDLNLTPDSPGFASLLGEARLVDVFAGRGWQPTWMTSFWPLALRIDHVLASPSLCIEQAVVGPDVGSDHRPVVVRLGLRSR
jgi:endonuclease/exonuclease/phosphatase (EEP) superfamily protein YafD